MRMFQTYLYSVKCPFRKFNSSAIEAAVSLLRPDNMIVFLESKAFENEADQVEKWYSTPYSKEKLDLEFLSQLQSPQSPSSFDIPSYSLKAHFLVHSTCFFKLWTVLISICPQYSTLNPIQILASILGSSKVSRYTSSGIIRITLLILQRVRLKIISVSYLNLQSTSTWQ